MGMTFKQGDSEEAYEDYDAYAALNRQSLLRKPFVPYVAAGVVALVVILGFTMYGTSAKDSALAEEVALLAKHLDDIEFRLGRPIPTGKVLRRCGKTMKISTANSRPWKPSLARA
jgi:hypothetical protein